MRFLGFFEKIKVRLMNNEQYIQYLRKRGVRIGVNCNISKDANFGSEPWLIKIGNNVRITKGVDFITHDGGVWTLRKMGLLEEEDVIYGRIVIEDNCNISWNTTIMPGVIIHKNCITAAGSVVTKDIPEGVVVGGIPARKIETVEEYYDKVKSKVVPTYSLSEVEKLSYLKRNCSELFGE